MSKVTNKHFKESKCIESAAWWFDTLVMALPPGPRFIPFKYSINLQKCGMPIFCIACMLYFDNWSLACWVYTALHGTYGVFWYMKSVMTPDPWFDEPQTLLSSIGGLAFVLGPYSSMMLFLAAGWVPEEVQNPHPERIFLASVMYICGIIAMLGADQQKYFTLRERRYLLDDCWMAWTRNPNYLGEMLLYAAFNVVAQCEHMWIFLPVVWGTLFNFRMQLKEYQLSKKEGWEEYKQRTWILLPKLYGSSATTACFYLLLASTFYTTLAFGGMEATLKLLVKATKEGVMQPKGL